jgi:Kef-type K+ transport system membrane component KefB
MLIPGHPIFWLLVAAVLAPLLAEIPLGFRVPVVVLEVILGIVIGPHGLGLVHFDGFLEAMFLFGMSASLFMAGMELEWGRIRGRPIALASVGWIVSLLLAVAIVWLLRHLPLLHLPMIVALVLATTSLGVLLPILRDGRQLDTRFGSLFLAAGSVGEVGPIVVMSLLLSRQYSTWQEAGFLVVFLVIVALAATIGMGARPPRLLALLTRTMHSSTQLPVRIALLLMAGLLALAQEFGFESIFGAFAAGLIVGLATRGEDGEPLRHKIDAVLFGWFFPFFFVGTGVKFDLPALTQSITTMALVPTFLLLFLVVRGLPVMLLYRKDLVPAERAPFALSSAVASLSIIVVITEVTVRRGAMGSDVAAALVGAALLSVLLFPTIAGILLSRRTAIVDLPMKDAP